MMVVNGGTEPKRSNTSVEAHDRKTITSKTSLGSQKSDEGSGSRRPKSSSGTPVPKLKKNDRPKTVEASEVTYNKLPSDKGQGKKSTELSLQHKQELSQGNASPDRNESPEPEFQAGAEETKSDRGSVRLTGYKKQSEIPKLKSLLKVNPANVSKPTAVASKLPVKCIIKDTDTKLKKPESIIAFPKTDKKDDIMKEDFSYIVPLYESELKKVRDAWVNTIYCSLTMRTHLVKLLFQTFPTVNKGQFQIEDEKLLSCIANAKHFTKSEGDNLIQFIKTLLASEEKAKQEYGNWLKNKDIAEAYNYDWKNLNRKLVDYGEELKQIQVEVPEVQKKKDMNEISQRQRMRRLEVILSKKDEELKKLNHQLSVLREKETAYRLNSKFNESFKDIKAEVMLLKDVGKEYEELKAKFVIQNEMYEKKIKELEALLEEKKNVLQKEKKTKKKLKSIMGQLEEHQKILGKEQVNYFMRKSSSTAEKRREKVWTAAVQLVLRGFLTQMKKLERDRNRMLLELQTCDAENFNSLATTIIKKENFIRTIRTQMTDFQKACK